MIFYIKDKKELFECQEYLLSKGYRWGSGDDMVKDFWFDQGKARSIRYGCYIIEKPEEKRFYIDNEKTYQYRIDDITWSKFIRRLKIKKIL